MNSLAFAWCFAAWKIDGARVAFVVDNVVYQWDRAVIGLWIGASVSTGALLRPPVVLLTDNYGGRVVFSRIMLVAAVIWASSATRTHASSSSPQTCSSGWVQHPSPSAQPTPRSPSRLRNRAPPRGLQHGRPGARLTVIVAPFPLRPLSNDGVWLAA